MDESAFLQETLAFLEACEVDVPPGLPEIPVVDAVQQLVASPSSFEQEKPSTALAKGSSSSSKRRNPSRERMLAELRFLREKVVELELQLNEQRDRALVTRNAMQDKDNHGMIWERVARRQWSGRVKSEQENLRLRATLEAQISLANSLQAMLRQNGQVELWDSALTAGPNVALHPDDVTVYHQLMNDLDAAHARLDEVFDSSGMTHCYDESNRHAYARTRPLPGTQQEMLYMELVYVSILPFEVHLAGGVAWRSVLLRYLQENHAVYQNVDQPENTIAVKFRIKRHHSRELVGHDGLYVDVKLVMRRYKEANRMVHVWRAISIGENSLSGMYTDETGWSVLSKVPPEALNSDIPASTAMRSCVQMVPKRAVYSPASQRAQAPPPEVGLLTKLVVNSYEEDVIAITHTMENLLLEEALAVGTRSTEQQAREFTQSMCSWPY